MADVEQRIVQISGTGRIHKAFGGPGVLKSARENAHDALSGVGGCFGGGDDKHSDKCDRATALLENLRSLVGASVR